MPPPPWLQAVTRDLRKSWFFRIWALCWTIVAVFILAALFLFSEARFGVVSSNQVDLEVLNVSSMAFPRFSFRVVNASLASINCSHEGTPITTAPCLASPSSDCVAIPEGILAINDIKLPPANREINCVVNISSPGIAPRMQWNLDTKDMYPFGPDEFAIVTVDSSTNARVILVKHLQTTRLGSNQVSWDKTLTYVDPPSGGHSFYISTVIGNFQVTSYNQMTWESQNSGWLYCARLGGIMYFTRCLHGLLMFLLSLLLTNDSAFLLGHWKTEKAESKPLGEGGPSYNSVTNEHL